MLYPHITRKIINPKILLVIPIYVLPFVRHRFPCYNILTNMKEFSLSNNIFLFFSGWGFLGVLLAWTGKFNAFWFIAYTIVFCMITLLVAWRSRHKVSDARPSSLLSRLSHYLFPALLACLLASFFQPTTYFSGRDEGSIFQASFELEQTRSLAFSSPESRAFFDIYHKGRALNYPGFYYTENGSLTTQFPIAYIAWLASFLSLFGLTGLMVANGTLLFLFFLAVTHIIQTFAPKKWGVIGMILLATSFPIFWFSRFTLSENFALAFLWIFIWSIYAFAHSPDRKKLFLLLLTGTLLLFGRIEGIAFLGMAALFLFYKKNTRVFLTKSIWIHIILPLILFALLAFISFSVNTPFYITIVKGFLEGSSEALSNAPSILSTFIDRISILFLYGIGLSLLLGSVGFYFLVKERSKENALTATLWIVLPSFLYLFISFISPDHPWMLRRFMFSIVPTFLLFSIFLCVKAESPRHRFRGYAFAFVLLIAQLSSLLYFFPISQGDDLLRSTKNIAASLPENDLVLVDQLASGDGFHMLSGPLQTLLSRHALYFMNPYDLDRLDLSDFSTVSLLVPEGREDIYAPILAEHGARRMNTFPISFSTLESTSLSSHQFPKKIHIEQNVILYRWEASE